ncbi:hypothetical protein J8V57_04790 [Xenorhabdus sp. PB61.4]|uniref:DUF7823 domain-containing protein n=1 Tax=Xenorhabdus sp. PB61.4 TaxID=2788940 RepID=UPI001E4B3D5E|nr:hypothetical protein [Xenorhabdus sp. PB61.4]MCC8365600.1 hypothetical protein [Xenorhabdus sp. PB61.4]
MYSDFGQIYIRASSDNSQTGYQKMIELFKKELTITVNHISYHLGSAGHDGLKDQQQYEFVGAYYSDDAKKLGTLLKQNLGNTLHFCFNWK